MTTDTIAWTPYIERKPEAAGLYRWRMECVRMPGLIVEFDAKMRMRGAGYGEPVLSPEFDRWDGYNLHVPSCEWANTSAESRPSFPQHQPLPCSRCSAVPIAKGVERSPNGGVFIGAGPPQWNSWWLECCAWSTTPHMEDPRELVVEWNRRNCAEREAKQA